MLLQTSARAIQKNLVLLLLHLLADKEFTGNRKIFETRKNSANDADRAKMLKKTCNFT